MMRVYDKPSYVIMNLKFVLDILFDRVGLSFFIRTGFGYFSVFIERAFVIFQFIFFFVISLGSSLLRFALLPFFFPLISLNLILSFLLFFFALSALFKCFLGYISGEVFVISYKNVIENGS